MMELYRFAESYFTSSVGPWLGSLNSANQIAERNEYYIEMFTSHRLSYFVH